MGDNMTVSQMTQFPPDATHELQGLTAFEVSLVDRAANKRVFLLTKEESAESVEVVGEDHPLRAALVKAAQAIAIVLDGQPHDAYKDTEGTAFDLLKACGHEIVEREAPEPSAAEAVAVAAETAELDADAILEQGQRTLHRVDPSEPGPVVEIEQEATPDPVEVLLADALAEPTPDLGLEAIDAVLREAEDTAIRQELETTKRELEIAKAEREAQAVITAHELEMGIAKAREDALAEARTEHEGSLEKLRAEYEAKLSIAQDELAKAQSANEALNERVTKTQAKIQTAAAARSAVRQLAQVIQRGKIVPRSQVVQSGEESPPAVDPWETIDFK